MKKCIVISDSFKGTLSSLAIGKIAKESIGRFFPLCEVKTFPVADGGEGTVQCFMQALGADLVKVKAKGPYFEEVDAFYARKDNKAIIEMACCAGLPMVQGRLNPAVTTTYGVGQLIRHAVENGCTEILLGLGGSCTNDAGCGCAAALGVVFKDSQGQSFIPSGGTLEKIESFDASEASKLLKNVKITVMCDVDNPLYGERGAAYIFGPQKGADEDMVRLLDQGLRKFDETVQKITGKSVADVAGAGAAGGMGGGCMVFLNAALKSGIEAVLDMVNFDECLEGADLVITGEGRIDSQSVHGKVISGIVNRTKPKNVPVVAIVGSIHDSAVEAYDLGVTAMFGIDRLAVDFKEYASISDVYYQRTLEDILRLIKAAEAMKV